MIENNDDFAKVLLRHINAMRENQRKLIEENHRLQKELDMQNVNTTVAGKGISRDGKK